MATKLITPLAMMVVLVGLLSAPAAANTITYTDSIALDTTNWSDTVSIPKFNPTFGTLDSIKYTLTGHVEGTAKFENQDGAAATITMDLSSILKLQRPDLTTIVISVPVASTSDDVAAYDGVLDYAGTSGKTYSNLSNDLSENVTSSTAADIALFTGTGDIVMPVLATGASTGSGSGNLVLQFATAASANVEVVYTYTVPEPTTMGLLSLGGLALIRRRK